MKKRKKVNIYFSVDDNYVPYLLVTLASLVDHASDDYKYDITVVHNGLSFQSKQKLRRYNHLENIYVHFFSVDFRMQNLNIKLDVRDYYTLTTYYRLFLPECFPLINKAVYLDCDIVLMDDVAKLYSIDLGDNYLGAVPDTSVQIIPEFSNYVQKVIDVNYEQYFNAGVLVMNFKKLREVKFQKQSFDLLSRVTFKVAQDQDVLNYLAKNHVKLLPVEWNTMPLGDVIENPKLIHFNLMYKPWNLENIRYDDKFFYYAEKAGVKDSILETRSKIPEFIKEKLLEGVEGVKEFCVLETKNADIYYAQIHNTQKVKRERITFETIQMQLPSINNERQEILDKIVELERQGQFDKDVENDPPYRPIVPGEVDYLRKKWYSKLKTAWASYYSGRYFKRLIKRGDIIIDGTSGIEHLKKLKTGAIVTANHFNPFDSIPINLAARKHTPNRKVYTIIREGNYSFPGLYGFFMRNCRSLPLSSNPVVLRELFSAIKTILKKGNLILIYPEQSMWWNYRKPKPLKIGAFRFAAENNVPILPTFITMRDTKKRDGDGLKVQAYALHILAPIYPDPELTVAQNVEMMKTKNEQAWKECYEKTYGIPLTYITEEKK